MMHTAKWLSTVGMALGLIACGGASNDPVSTDSAAHNTAMQADAAKVGAPSSGRLLAIGQDIDSIRNYITGMGAAQTPGAVVGYIDMDLNGLNNSADNGAGRNNLSELARTYPNSAVVVAVYAVGKLDAINAGQLDGNITTLINTLKGYNRPVYLRFGYEFDGPWNNYDPTAYKAAFTRFKNRIDALSAGNQIAMVWQSSSYCEGGVVTTAGGRAFSDWYPGDNVVDLVAVSYFTPSASSSAKGGTCNTANQAINNLASFSRAHSKPLMIAESTPQGYSTEARTWHSNVFSNNANAGPVTDAQISTWYQDYFAWINQNDVRVVTYINANWNAQSMWASGANGYWGDSRVEANTTIKALWQNSTTSYLKANTPNLFTTLGFATGGGGTGAKTLVVRARGTSGQESVTLQVGGQTVRTWTLTTAMTNYTISTTLAGGSTLSFTNDAAGRDVQVESLSVNNQVRLATDQTSNTGVYQNGACGGGNGRSQWLHCNGAIGFGNL
jgi:beta-mannanase